MKSDHSTTHSGRRLHALFILLAIPFVAALAMPVSAHDVDHPAVKVRVVSYDPATSTYTFSCQVPNSTQGSQISDRRFYAIDPVPAGHNRSHYSTSEFITWRLDPTNYTELVHTKALYHVYCEVQNYSAPPGEQNMASEFHVDLRTDDNADVPDIYVLRSRGNDITLKCEPPDGTRDHEISWAYRSRSGRVDLPQLKDQRIVNITLPQTGSGWDIVCSVFDRFTGKTTSWDMPLETFADAPAYVPTVEGCAPHETCPMFPDGVPGSALTVRTQPGTAVYLNEELGGTTDSNGALDLTGITPGVYNLVLRKQGYAEASTLIPLAAGKTTSRSYTLAPPSSAPDPWNMCHNTIHSLPVNCTGTVTADQVSGGCRTITCAVGGDSIKVLACNKPTSADPQYFEMYKQSQTGNGARVCLGVLCMRSEGFLKSPSFPICLGTGNASGAGNQTNQTNQTNATCTPAAEICDGNDNDCDMQIDENGVCGTPPPANQTCYNGVQSIPAACEGAAISSDTWNGGRQITCGTTRIAAWDKSGFFEMYKQAGGSAVKICIGQTCIKENGYAKSANFPICIASNATNSTNSTNHTNTTPACAPSIEICDLKDNDCDSQVDEENVCGTAGGTCHSSVFTMPAACSGGSISTDETSSGCRKIICTGAGGSIQALACNKPGNYQPTHFEIYKQATTGTPPKICVLGTCVQGNGYAKSPTYPVCA